MVDYTDHAEMLKLLASAQEADSDNRKAAREADHFVNKRDGQWEPSIIANMSNRPRYTFDKCNPIIDQIMGEIEQSEFEIKVRPASGSATKEIAKTRAGLIRNIESISETETIYNSSARAMVTSGLDGWEVVQDWVDDDAFEQDILIKKISNYIDRVWLDDTSEMQDGSDAMHAWKLKPIKVSEYEERWPEGSRQSVGDDRCSNVYEYKPDDIIIIGQFYYIKKKKRKLVLMSNNAVYEDNEDYQKIKDELAAAGITEEKSRTREHKVVYTRLFDNGDWLNEAKETVFDFIPIIPTYGNFKISENKVIYWGAVEKLIDPQRVYNYAKSRQIEEGALAPKEKFWMTREQAEGNTAQLSTLNTNTEPVQFYKHIEGQPQPYKTGGPQVNPGLQATAQDAAQDISVSAGLFSSNMGDETGLLSGVAIDKLQHKGDNGTYKYFASQRIAIRHTCRIINSALPKVYDTKRQQRILGEDGTEEIVTLNDVVFDQQTQKSVEINNLSQGIYDVSCEVGPAYDNRQQETVKAITEIATIDPAIIQTGKDVLLDNINAPGIDILSERVRSQMVDGGLIPETQLTDDEKALLQQRQLAQAQQGQQPSPLEQAVIQEAQSNAEKAQANTADIMSKIEERQAKIQLEAQKLLMQGEDMQQKNAIAIEELAAKMEKATMESQLKMQAQNDNVLKIQAETLKAIKEAMGVDAIVGPGNTEAYTDQAERITETQERLPMS